MKVRSFSGVRHLARSVIAALSCACSAANAIDAAFPVPAVDRSNGQLNSWVSDRIGRASLIERLDIALPIYARSRRNAGGHRVAGTTSTHRAATLEVTNCDDAGSGSLRDTIASAASGDTVDLSQLTCSTITLTSNYLTVLQDDLTITGPGATSLAIDGGGALPLLAHYGTGTLSMDGLTLTNGYYYYHGTRTTTGGCIASSGNVVIQNSVVSNCTIHGYATTGGAIYTLGNLTVVSSVITHNRAVGTSLAGSGAARVRGDLTLQYSTISDNVASSPGPYSFAGGFHVNGNVLIQNSTISGNQARNFAAFLLGTYNNSPTALMINSTVSNNRATDGGSFGGGYTAKVPLTIYNSTIAFNTGVSASGIYAYNAPLTLQSTIIADNDPTDLRLGGTATVSGANNLINRGPTVPPGTIRDCPQLGPLADNGGVTLTHALRRTSPAVDSGSNLNATSYDQRGMGFPRVFGVAADIGAVESQGGPDDSVFNSGFEAICDH